MRVWKFGPAMPTVLVANPFTMEFHLETVGTSVIEYAS